MSKDNLHLPKTAFSMKASLPTKEPEILKKCDQKQLKKEIDVFCNKVIQISKQNNRVYFFLWPLDINDNFFGNLNQKYGYKSWLINFINLKVSEMLSNSF